MLFRSDVAGERDEARESAGHSAGRVEGHEETVFVASFEVAQPAGFDGLRLEIFERAVNFVADVVDVLSLLDHRVHGEERLVAIHGNVAAEHLHLLLLQLQFLVEVARRAEREIVEQQRRGIVLVVRIKCVPLVGDAEDRQGLSGIVDFSSSFSLLLRLRNNGGRGVTFFPAAVILDRKSVV